MGDDKIKLGLMGAEIPVDWYNKLSGAIQQYSLSDAAQRRLIAWGNAKESMTGYQRVLSGSNRGSDKVMQLNIDVLPTPISPQTFASEGFRQFKENIPIVARGLPRMPGIPNPTDILGTNASTGSTGQRRVIDLR